MSHIEQRGTRWRAVRRENGQRITRNFATKTEAQAFIEGVELVTPAGASPRRRVPTLGEFLDDGGYAMDDLRPNTVRSYNGLLSSHVRPQFASTPLDKITHRDVQEWLQHKNRSGLSPASVKQLQMALQRILNAAIRHGHITENVAKGTKTVPVQQLEMRFLSVAELQKLEAEFDERWASFVMLAGFSGLRLGEMLGLRWRNVDLFAGLVHVVEQLNTNDGRFEMTPPKTRAGKRSVSIPRVVVNMLADRRRALEANAGRITGDEFVYAGEDGQPLDGHNFRNRVWRPAVAAAGLDPLRIHDLRHTAVSFWIASGLDVLDCKKRAGHSSAAFTMDRYGHLAPGRHAEQASKLDAFLAR